MKTLKVLLLAALVSFAMVSFAQNNERETNEKSMVYLKMVLDKPMYVNALINQVDRDAILNGESTGFILVKIRVHHNVWVVAATYPEWVSFFNRSYNLPIFKKSPEGMMGDR